MRVAAALMGALLLAGCASAPEMPPSVSYHVPDHNVAITSEEAQNFCLQFDRAAQYQGLKTTDSGLVAVYTCVATPAAPVTTTPTQ
jgi:PBP1b-binding outer membrane lipoprotein LpoB